MKTIVRVLLSIVLVIAALGVVAYVNGTTLPVEHSTTVSAIVDAPPAKVFHIITNVADGASWRKSVKAVYVQPPDQGRDHWIEDLGHGQTMNFLATRTEPLDASGVGRRNVLLSEPKASYGGTWRYEVSPGDSPNQTRLKITEDGFIHPPIYRFMMRRVIGMTHNLDQYMADIKAAAIRS